MGIVILIGTIGVVAMSAKQDEQRAAAEAAKTPEQRGKEAKARADELKQQTLIANAVLLLKKAMKDPASFVLTSAYGGGGNAGCIEYRGVNSYGAALPASAVVLKDGNILVQEKDGNRFVAAWNKACAKGGPDFKVVIDMALRRQ